jgi:putative colanic acid biosynthesis glycosyltransferase
MKTVLLINFSANKYSSDRIVVEIGELAIANGWTGYLAYGRKMTCCSSKLIQTGSSLNTKLHAIQTRLFDNHEFASKYATKRFIS